jgi:hypothetical protein
MHKGKRFMWLTILVAAEYKWHDTHVLTRVPLATSQHDEEEKGTGDMQKRPNVEWPHFIQPALLRTTLVS